MLKYLLKRLAILIPTFIGITIVCFAVIHLAPGEPTGIQAELNPKITPEAIEQLKRHYGLDKPLTVQYLVWMKNLARLDFGNSISSDSRPVWDKIKERLPITISINVASMVIIFLIAIPLGVISAVNRGSPLDRSITVFVFIGFSIPGFWLALICMDLFGVRLGWLPISGIHSSGYEHLGFLGRQWDLAKHMALPVIISAKFDQVQKHLTLTGHVYSPCIFVMNKAAFDKLSAADKQAFIDAAKEGTKANRARVDEDDAKGVADLRAKGMTVVDNPDKAKFVAALAPVNAEFEKQFGKATLDKIRAVK